MYESSVLLVDCTSLKIQNEFTLNDVNMYDWILSYFIEKITGLKYKTRFGCTILMYLCVQRQKWATFTFFGNETRFTTTILGHSTLRIAYRTKNSHPNLVKSGKLTSKRDNFKKSGVYQLTCEDCVKKYKG